MKDKNIDCHIDKNNISHASRYHIERSEISKKDLRVFLGIWAGIFAVFLLAGVLRGDTVRIWALCGFALSIAFMAIPRVILPFYRVWLKFGEIMGFVISRIILALIFFGIFTPLGIIFRVFKRDILGLKLAFGNKDKSQSLFKIREIAPTSMKNQF